MFISFYTSCLCFFNRFPPLISFDLFIDYHFLSSFSLSLSFFLIRFYFSLRFIPFLIPQYLRFYSIIIFPLTSSSLSFSFFYAHRLASALLNFALSSLILTFLHAYTPPHTLSAFYFWVFSIFTAFSSFFRVVDRQCGW